MFLSRHPVYVILLAASALSLNGCTLVRVANAWIQPKISFTQCTPDPRIWCEPGSGELANRIAPLLSDAVAIVERAQFSSFTSPVVIYTYNSAESFSAHSGAVIYAAGAVSLGRLNLSPKLLATPDRTKGILIHELSHLNLQLQMGSLAWARVPSWFHEGLATFVSNGGGAETISVQDATVALLQGKRFNPDESQWAAFPKSALSYGLTPHMYYRQAALFVGFLHDSDPMAFQRMLHAIAAKITFSEAVNLSYHENLASLWLRFLSSNYLAEPAHGTTAVTTKLN